MAEEKKLGVTHSIREKLNFLDERLWKRFSARRLELIDTLDLSSRKASEQEDEIKKVAEILRLEFKFDQRYIGDFDKLVRAAVQSVRRNRKRSTKSKRSNGAKRPRMSSEGSIDSVVKSENRTPEPSRKDDDRFLSEITRLNTDANDEVYDMNYPRTKSITKQDQSRVAIGTLIQPVSSCGKSESRPHLGVMLPPLSDTNTPGPQAQAENEKELQAIRLSLLLLIKRSRSCLESTTKTRNDFLRGLGQNSIAAIAALVFEKSFINLNQTSIDYLSEKLLSHPFLAQFYRSLEPESIVNRSLDDETASLTLQTLIGCCIKDFGFDRILYPLGEAFYRSILLDYPLVSSSSQPFLRADLESFQQPASVEIPPPSQQNGDFSLTNLAAVATELRSHNRPPSPDSSMDKKSVVLRFLSSSLRFTYPTKHSAPPRFVEIMENATQAFKLNGNQIYGLRNCKTGAYVTCDFELEKIFKHEDNIELEIFPQSMPAIPIYKMANTITPARYSDDTPRIILPPPYKQSPTAPPVIPEPIIPPPQAQATQATNISNGIYRSGFPMPINYPFMKQLKLKTIIYVGDLCHEKAKKKGRDEKPKKDKNGTAEIYEKYKAWIESTDINFHPLLVHSSQEPFTSIETQAQTQESLRAALHLILDKRNFPILIHSNKGKHRIGVLVGLLRKLLQGWCMSGIFEEYEKFAMGKSEFDLEFIEMWQPELTYEQEWLPDFVRTT
ncbi:hypothetical protein ACQ2H7_002735 [Candidozyma auris]